MKNIDISIIITHYNQNQYLKNCINSILKQKDITYQLIIIDDCSDNFDRTKIENYIKNNKKENLKSITIIENKENIGTTKSLNKTLKNIEGDYSVFVAADDELNKDNCLIENINYLKNHNFDILITQQNMMDNNLKNLYYKYVEPQFIKIIESRNNEAIFNLLSRGCFFPAGATLYKSSYIKKSQFDEECRLIEDWTTYLRACLLNTKIGYHNITTINHRDGGLSHSAETTKSHEEFIQDIYTIYCKYLIPNMKHMSFCNRIWVTRSFKYYKDRFGTTKLKINKEYSFTRYILIVWYTLIRIKNYVDSRTFLNITLLLLILDYNLNSNFMSAIFKIYTSICSIFMIFNIIYKYFEKNKKNKESQRR